MAKFAILSASDEIARPLEGARTQIVIEVFHMVLLFETIYQDHFFKFKNFYCSLHPTNTVAHKSK